MQEIGRQKKQLKSKEESLSCCFNSMINAEKILDDEKSNLENQKNKIE